MWCLHSTMTKRWALACCHALRGGQDSSRRICDLALLTATGVRIPLGTPKYDTNMTGKLGSANFPVFVCVRIQGPRRAPP